MVVGLDDAARRIGQQLEFAAPYGVRLTGFFAEARAVAPSEIELGARYPVHALIRKWSTVGTSSTMPISPDWAT